MQKYFFVVLIVIFALFSLVGCGDTSEAVSIPTDNIKNNSSLSNEIEMVTDPIFEVKDSETMPEYTYWDEDKRVDGLFYYQKVLVTGTVSKKDCLEYIRGIETEQSSIETRVGFYSAFDDAEIMQHIPL